MRKPIVRVPKVPQKERSVCPICHMVIAPREDNIISFHFSDGGSVSIHFHEVYAKYRTVDENGIKNHYLPKLRHKMEPNFNLIDYFNEARQSIVEAIKNKSIDEGKLENTIGLMFQVLDEAKVERADKPTLALSSYYGGFNEFRQREFMLNPNIMLHKSLRAS